MQLVLEKRAERSNTIALVSPLIAIGLTGAPTAPTTFSGGAISWKS